MEKKLYDLKIDPDFETLIPPLLDTELSMLTDSILANGCEMPLVVWDGTIVDGHNRYRICHENDVPFAVEEKRFESREAAKIWLIRNQLGRRNLSDFQRCELILPLEELLKAEAEKRKLLGKKSLPDLVPNLAQGQARTRDTLATMANVSHGTLDKAKKIIASADKETKDRLRKGEMSIHKAYTELKQTEPQKSASTKATTENKPENISLLKKPVFDHYEPQTYMAPIPFEPVVPNTPEPAPVEATAQKADAAPNAVQDLIQSFLRDLDEALGDLERPALTNALAMIRDAGEAAIQTVKKYLNEFQEEENP